jgi:hypothetical protein
MSKLIKELRKPRKGTERFDILDSTDPFYEEVHDVMVKPVTALRDGSMDKIREHLASGRHDFQAGWFASAYDLDGNDLGLEIEWPRVGTDFQSTPNAVHLGEKRIIVSHGLYTPTKISVEDGVEQVTFVSLTEWYRRATAIDGAIAADVLPHFNAAAPSWAEPIEAGDLRLFRSDDDETETFYSTPGALTDGMAYVSQYATINAETKVVTLDRKPTAYINVDKDEWTVVEIRRLADELRAFADVVEKVVGE